MRLISWVDSYLDPTDILDEPPLPDDDIDDLIRRAYNVPGGKAIETFDDFMDGDMWDIMDKLTMQMKKENPSMAFETVYNHQDGWILHTYRAEGECPPGYVPTVVISYIATIYEPNDVFGCDELSIPAIHLARQRNIALSELDEQITRAYDTSDFEFFHIIQDMVNAYESDITEYTCGQDTSSDGIDIMKITVSCTRDPTIIVKDIDTSELMFGTSTGYRRRIAFKYNDGEKNRYKQFTVRTSPERITLRDIRSVETWFESTIVANNYSYDVFLDDEPFTPRLALQVFDIYPKFVKTETGQRYNAVRTSNRDSDYYVRNNEEFVGSNLIGALEHTQNGQIYVVLSYGWYPIHIFAQGEWFETREGYSNTTRKHISQSRPRAQDSIKLDQDLMEELRRTGDAEKVIKEQEAADEKARKDHEEWVRMRRSEGAKKAAATRRRRKSERGEIDVDDLLFNARDGSDTMKILIGIGAAAATLTAVGVGGYFLYTRGLKR